MMIMGKLWWFWVMSCAMIVVTRPRGHQAASPVWKILRFWKSKHPCQATLWQKQLLWHGKPIPKYTKASPYSTAVLSKSSKSSKNINNIQVILSFMGILWHFTLFYIETSCSARPWAFTFHGLNHQVLAAVGSPVAGSLEGMESPL